MEEDLLTRLRGNADVSALVGERVHWAARPQGGALPAITLHMISPGRGYDHGGANGLRRPRVQIDCWGATHASAKAVARAAIAALEPAATIGTTDFVRGFLDGERDFEPGTLADGTKVHRVTIDFFLWWRTA